MDVPEREYKNLGFGKIVKIVNPICFEIVAQTHARVPYTFSGKMVVHYMEVKLTKTPENIVELDIFWNCRSASCRFASILFSNSNFFSMGGPGKRV